LNNEHNSSKRQTSDNPSVTACLPLGTNKRSCYEDTSEPTTIFRYVCYTIIHIWVIAIYAIPVFVPSEYNERGNAVLDELHIISDSNEDINGRQHDKLWDILHRIITNDYWGRPMNSASSHKSWRPLSVILFRFVRGLRYKAPTPSLISFLSNDLNVHRLVNIITHATIAELVSHLATKIIVFPYTNDLEGSKSNNQRRHQPQEVVNNNHIKNNNNRIKMMKFVLRCITKIIFALHPTHVEVTANAANRPHLLALMCSLLISDPDTPWIVYIPALVSGYMFCETFLFQIIPATIMILSIQYIKLFHHSNYNQHHTNNNNNADNLQQQQQLNPTNKSQLSNSTTSIWNQIVYDTILNQRRVLLRLILFLLSGITYYSGRYYFDTLSIPTGLIRPAENPFFEFEGWDRFRNYSYVLSIHIAKQWDWDFIGFSHEYGYECLRAITTNDPTKDLRLFIPIVQLLLHIIVGAYLLLMNIRHHRNVLSIGLLLFIIHISWTVTLFPVAGIIKVGTFIADRLIVASTVSVTIIMANWFTQWIFYPTNLKRRTKFIILLALSLLTWKRIYQRTCQWMDSLPLLESSLTTCPRFAKAHLELSKIYSGLYKDKFNLEQSRWHLQQVESIDPNFCDVHQQFAHVAIQQHKYLEFEERLTNALLCPFTMGGSITMWQRYWNIALDTKMNPADVVASAQQRYNKYQQRINQAIIDDDIKKE
jgi:hypothetical protein